MKSRNGFVSNSSSSSFMILKKYLSPDQIRRVYEHDGGSDRWNISEDEDFLMGETSMDNFDMEEFLIKRLEVPEDKITWKDGHW